MWGDVKKETFERFVQFAYTGDYSIPEPIPRVENAVSIDSRSRDSSIKSVELNGNEKITGAITPPLQRRSLLDAWDLSKSKKDKKKKKGIEHSLPITNIPPPTDGFHMLSYPLRASRNPYTEDCEPPADFERSLSYSNVFLGHAALYVLGDFWLIDSLKALALFKLHKTLLVFELDGTNVEDILDLARYAYLDEGKGSGEGIGELKNLVCQYMASAAVALTVDESFMDLLRGGGQFVKDLWGFVVQK
jgi:hypothetical protein